MFHQLTILKNILVAIQMIKQHPHLDMVRILIVYYECFAIIITVDVPSTYNTEKHPSSDTDDKTSPSSGHG